MTTVSESSRLEAVATGLGAPPVSPPSAGSSADTAATLWRAQNAERWMSVSSCGSSATVMRWRAAMAHDTWKGLVQLGARHWMHAPRFSLHT
jgi:hypothetical protein